MISIIVSSYKPALLENLKKNIAATINLNYELIVIENHNKFSLTKAYNIGLDKAKFDFVVFMHEDIILKTTNWGSVVINSFKSLPCIGCLGLAGALSKTKAPSAWWETDKQNWVMHLAERDKSDHINVLNYGWTEDETFKEVSVIDGVFIAINKNNGLRFDDRIPGYHCYDLNISLAARAKNYKAYVTKEIFIEHLSSGNIDDNWFISTDILHSRYKHLLPLNLLNKVDKQNEHNNYYHFILKAYRRNLKAIYLKFWIKYFFSYPVSKNQYKLFKIIFLKSDNGE